MEKYILGITGASGALYALCIGAALRGTGAQVHVVATEMGARVLLHETGVILSAWAEETGCVQEDNSDLFSPIASGSFPCGGMIIAPCSMSTLGRLAAGVTTDLLARAADVSLKQRRPLVLVPRETPLSAIHLKNMLTLTECGAFMVPAMPGFYNHPQTVDELVRFVSGRALDCLGIDAGLYPRWQRPE